MTTTQETKTETHSRVWSDLRGGRVTEDMAIRVKQDKVTNDGLTGTLTGETRVMRGGHVRVCMIADKDGSRRWVGYFILL